MIVPSPPSRLSLQPFPRLWHLPTNEEVRCCFFCAPTHPHPPTPAPTFLHPRSNPYPIVFTDTSCVVMGIPKKRSSRDCRSESGVYRNPCKFTPDTPLAPIPPPRYNYHRTHCCSCPAVLFRVSDTLRPCDVTCFPPPPFLAQSSRSPRLFSDPFLCISRLFSDYQAGRCPAHSSTRTVLVVLRRGDPFCLLRLRLSSFRLSPPLPFPPTRPLRSVYS